MFVAQAPVHVVANSGSAERSDFGPFSLYLIYLLTKWGLTIKRFVYAMTIDQNSVFKETFGKKSQGIHYYYNYLLLHFWQTVIWQTKF